MAVTQEELVERWRDSIREILKRERVVIGARDALRCAEYDVSAAEADALLDGSRSGANADERRALVLRATAAFRAQVGATRHTLEHAEVDRDHALRAYELCRWMASSGHAPSTDDEEIDR